MSANNFTALAFQVVFSTIGFIFLRIVGELNLAVEVLIFLIVCIAYVLLGLFYPFEFFDSTLKNLFSVSSIFVGGILIWFFCYMGDQGGAFDYLVWLVFYVSFLPLSFPFHSIIEFLLGTEYSYSPPVLIIIITIFPTLCLWGGIELKEEIYKKVMLRGR